MYLIQLFRVDSDTSTVPHAKMIIHVQLQLQHQLRHQLQHQQRLQLRLLQIRRPQPKLQLKPQPRPQPSHMISIYLKIVVIHQINSELRIFREL
jgi:hypothetical protein